MAAGITRPSVTENVSTTLSAGITDIATTISVTDATGFVAPCYLMIDRVDSAGSLQSTSFWELVKVTSIASNDLTVTRAQNGTTGQAHSSGAIIEAVVSSAMFEEWYTVLNTEHDSAGGHVITGTMTVAGMNLASVATIASGAFTTLKTADLALTSQASLARLQITSSLGISGASLSGLPRVVGWVMPNNASAATVSLGKPLSWPYTGNIEWVSVTLRAPVSSASIIFDVNKNFGSIFDVGTRISILGGGTYASTASIATKALTQGNTLSADLDAGGSYADATLELGIYGA